MREWLGKMGLSWGGETGKALRVSMLLVSPPKRLDENSPNRLVL